MNCAGKIADLNHGPGRKRAGSFQTVFELSNVAGPVVSEKSLERIVAQCTLLASCP